MGKEMEKTKVRDAYMAEVQKYLAEKYDTDVLPVENGKLMIPVLDNDGNEGYMTIKFEMPRGKRVAGGYVPYNGYDAAEAYAADIEAARAEKEAKQKDKERAQKEKERKRAAKKTIKDLNEKGLEKMICEN